MSCIQKVKEWIETNELLKPPSDVIVAVSGGPDSMALLSIMHELTSYFGYNLMVAFFHHGIRYETDREQKLVEEFAGNLGLSVITGRASIPNEAEKEKMGIEETARKSRYRFFRELTRKEKAEIVALGHTADDQIETILHHIIRGTGLRGLTGIPAKRGPFIRPLLSCKHSELLQYLKERNIDYAIDKTNWDNIYTRNRIRNDLLPYLRKHFNPSIDRSILRLQENISGAMDSIQDLLKGITISVNQNNTVSIPVREISSLDGFSLYLLSDYVLREKFNIHQDFDKSHFDSMKNLIRNGQSGRELHFPHQISVIKEQQEIIFTRNKNRTSSPAEEPEFLLPSPGEYLLKQRGILVKIGKLKIENGHEIQTGPLEGWFGNIKFPLKVRNRREGDILVPFGMRGKKKLSDIFIDSKIPLHQRDKMPVFEDAEGIIWVPGVVTAERARITPETEEAIVIKITEVVGEKEVEP